MMSYVFYALVLAYSDFSFFFFKQKTAYEMRISDWSSDVCSSDLPRRGEEVANAFERNRRDRLIERQLAHARRKMFDIGGQAVAGGEHGPAITPYQCQHVTREDQMREIGRASCRERVCQYV